jgi:two-component system, OmpR family, response regulator
MATILIVDDDPHIRELVRYLFEKTGFEVAEAADGRDALAVLEGQSVDCAVIDVMMPRMDGWDLCRAVKAAWDVPVLMLTARRETAQKVKGLTIGADDYLVKPFESEELLARVRALLRRWKREEQASVGVGRAVLERATREAVVDGERISLPQKEFELLLKLGSRPGITFSREAVIQDVWGMDFDGTERTVDVHVNRLRDRLPQERSGFRIVALRGIGYRLEVAE